MADKPQHNPVVWFEIYVDDMARAKAFYEAVLEVKLSPLGAEGMDMMAFPACPENGGAGGALVRMKGVKPGGGGTLVYFGCEDCALPSERAKAAGGSIHNEKFSIGEHGFIALCVDTEGNMFGLHSMK